MNCKNRKENVSLSNIIKPLPIKHYIKQQRRITKIRNPIPHLKKYLPLQLKIAGSTSMVSSSQAKGNLSLKPTTACIAEITSVNSTNISPFVDPTDACGVHR